MNPHSLISARILGRSPQHAPDKSLLVHRLQVAQSLRRPLYEKPFYRLVYGESDALPGLVLDRFGDVLVGQIATAGMEALRPQIEAAVKKVIAPAALVWKNDASVRDMEGLPHYVETVFGEAPESVVVEEGGVSYHVPLGTGQKTGWFFDQSANRLALRKYVGGARVLDVFSYLGAWGLGALKAGATEATCVDSSASALEQLQASAAANGLKPSVLKGDAFDVMESLHSQGAPLRCGHHRSAGVHQAQKRPAQGRGRVQAAQPARHAVAGAATASWCRAPVPTTWSRTIC